MKTFLIALLLLASNIFAEQRSRAQLILTGGWAEHNGGSLNDHYLDGFAIPFGIFDDRLTDGPAFQGSVRVPVRSVLSLELGLVWAQDGTSGSYQSYPLDSNGVVIDTIDVNTELSANIWAPYFGLVLTAHKGKVLPWVGAGLAYCIGQVEIKSRSGTLTYANEFRANAIRPYLDLGLLCHIWGRFSLAARGGYRHFVTGTLEDNEGKWVVDYPSAHEIELDFAGPYFEIGLAFGAKQVP